jgi:hypothetical protein
VFVRNPVVFRSDDWVTGGVNIGPNTAPKTFKFAEDLWYCEDRPDRSAPGLPTTEAAGTVDQDPKIIDAAKGDSGTAPGSPATGRGASAFK